MVLARAAVAGDILLRDNLPELEDGDDTQKSQMAAML
jgi:hypothetical protein